LRAKYAPPFHGRHRRNQVTIEKPRRRGHVRLVLSHGSDQDRNISRIELAVAVDVEQDIGVPSDGDADRLLKGRSEPAGGRVPDHLSPSLPRSLSGPV
jgi:hypothetical protein